MWYSVRIRTSRPALALQAAVAALTLASSALRASPARACGGFFCSQTAPVDQAGEEIIFVDHADDTITALIRIQYDGPAERFAWLLPIPGVPDVSVSSNVVFDRLRVFSNPRFELNVRREGECKDDFEVDAGDDCPFCDGLELSAAGQSTGDDRSAVSLLASSSVGPYDYSVISVDASADDPAQAALEWLDQNAYDVTGVAPDLLRPYLADGLNLIAFKLSKGRSDYSGAIRPVRLSYRSRLPMIPIRLTAVAAQDDMGVLVWVLGDAQAVPRNFKSLVINEALVDWARYGSNYRQVVSAAADEAGGQGFVTEMAGDAGQLEQAVFTQADAAAWAAHQAASFSDGFELIGDASFLYRSWDGFREAVRAAVTLPRGVAFEDFGRTPELYRDVAQIDAEVFRARLAQDVIEPVIAAQELLRTRSYFTRLFSTLSADEMTVDPLFDFNPDLAELSNVHVAEQVIECAPDRYAFESPWRIQLPQGALIRGDNSSGWPICGGPANLMVWQRGDRGEGALLIDNRWVQGLGLGGEDDALQRCDEIVADGGAIDGGSGQESARPPRERPGAGMPPPAADDGGCAVRRVSDRAAQPPIWLAIAAACLLLRRRRS